MTRSAGRRARAVFERSLADSRRLLRAGRYGEAIEALLAAAQLAPNDPAVANDLGVAYMATRQFEQAITCFHGCIASRPEIGATYYNLGLALQNVGDDDAAMDAYRQAIALDGDLASAHGQLADLLAERGTIREAVAAYESAYACAPNTSEALLWKVKALDAQHRSREAETWLNEVIARDPSCAQAHVRLGRLLQEAGRFAEATASFERSIAIDPWQANGYQGLVSCRRFGDGDGALITELAARAGAKEWEEKFSPVVAARHRMMLHFTVGKALDDVGDYEEAFAHFSAGNVLRRRLCPFDRDEVARRADQIVARFHRDVLARYASNGHEDETPILIVGMPRSGTTLVERILSSHPRIRGCGELEFWNERGPAWVGADIDELAKAGDALRVDYLRELRGGDGDPLRATDKMPFNFFWVGLVHVLFPKARFVWARRDPLDTCLSIHTTAFTADWGFASTTSDLAFYYRLHLRLIAHWREVIPADRILEVDYEDVVAEPERSARRLIDFAGLSWDDVCLRPDANPDEVRTASSWQARQPIYRGAVGRWRHYEPWLRELREQL